LRSLIAGRPTTGRQHHRAGDGRVHARHLLETEWQEHRRAQHGEDRAAEQGKLDHRLRRTALPQQQQQQQQQDGGCGRQRRGMSWEFTPARAKAATAVRTWLYPPGRRRTDCRSMHNQ